MQNDDIVLPLDIYSKHLQTINGIGFTSREIDIIACILSGRSPKTIPSFLSIAAKTVASHISRIRLKTGCGSRESIVDFIENSNAALIIKNQYYLSLLVQISFEKCLRKMPKVESAKAPLCLIVYEREQRDKYPFIHYLEDHLRLAGFKTEIKIREGRKFFVGPLEGINSRTTDHILYIIPEAVIAQSQSTKIENNRLEFPGISSEIQAEDEFIFLFPDKAINSGNSEELEHLNYFNFTAIGNYYLSFFKLLRKIKTSNTFDKIIDEFNQSCKEIYTPFEKTQPQTHLEVLGKTRDEKAVFFPPKRLKICAIGFLSISLICIVLLAAKWDFSRSNTHSIRSDLPILSEMAFLNRPGLMDQLNENFKGQQGIQTVALVGIGGSGKTTLARQYAHSQNLSIVWEINGESIESLISSFENLAYALSNTIEEKKVLQDLQELQNTNERNEKILSFLKAHLKSQSDWFLIYDNVDNFADIQHFFPSDSVTWGNGKVILTSRDSNIKNSEFINKVVEIGELTEDEKLRLFKNILKNNEMHQFYTQKDSMQKFLSNVPSFPLDVSLAAHYLKATNSTYENYLNNLTIYTNDSELMHIIILKSANNYERTRHSIISLSVKQLISAHKDFGSLLLFMSLLDSQNIPRDLLDSYKSDQIVDSFIYNLKKYSLITNQSFFDSTPTFSMHRNIQDIILSYLKKELHIEKEDYLTQEIISSLKKYMINARDQEDFKKIRFLISHCERFLDNTSIFNNSSGDSITVELADFYYRLSSYRKSQQILEYSLTKFKKYHEEDHMRMPQLLTSLGHAYRELGYYEKARNLLQQSLSIYKKYVPKNHAEAVRTLSALSSVYRSLGNYKMAKKLLEESLIIHKNYCLENHLEMARILTQLGIINRELGDYITAKDLLEQNLTLCKKHLPNNQLRVVRTLFHLGSIYRELGDYGKAKDLLEESLSSLRDMQGEDNIDFSWALVYLGHAYESLNEYIRAKLIFEKSLKAYEKYIGKKYHQKIAWILLRLGSVYGELGDYEKAKDLINQSYKLCIEHYGHKNTETARTLRSLGRIHFLESDMATAKELFNKALNIFQHNKHPDIYMVLEDLADLYLKKYSLEEDAGYRERSEIFKIQAITYLKQAIEVIGNYYPENSPHIYRIKNKFDNIK